jgi:hypothetical protein
MPAAAHRRHLALSQLAGEDGATIGAEPALVCPQAANDRLNIGNLGGAQPEDIRPACFLLRRRPGLLGAGIRGQQEGGPGDDDTDSQRGCHTIPHECSLLLGADTSVDPWLPSEADSTLTASFIA